MSSNQVFPYLPQNDGSVSQPFGFDLSIQKAYPGYRYLPTEPNGVYQVTREVSGTLCLVTNADWNPNTLRWEQNAPCNPATPAYALFLQADGSMVRLQAPATNIPGLQVNFSTLYTIDANGQIRQTPGPILSNTTPINAEIATWAAGSSVIMSGNELRIIDTASAPNSLVDSVYVNNTRVWAVGKDGELKSGSIPFALVTGFSPDYDNVTFTGLTTFNGPVDANSTFNIDNDLTVDRLTVEQISNHVGVATFTTINASTVNTNGLTAGPNPVNFSGTLDVVGQIEAGDFFRSDGARMSDSPALTTAPVTVPAPGGTVIVNVLPCSFLITGSTVMVAGTSNNIYSAFKGFVTAVNGSPATQITVSGTAVTQGAPGDIIATSAGVSYTTVTRFDSTNGTVFFTNTGTLIAPIINIQTDLLPLGGTLINQVRPSTTDALAGVTLTLPSLPFRANGASVNYLLHARAGARLSGGSTQTLTGSGAGVAWEAAQTDDDGNGGRSSFGIIGSAVSGQSPAITWQVIGGFDGPVGQQVDEFRFTATRSS